MFIADPHAIPANEAGMPLKNAAPRHAVKPCFQVIVRSRDDRILARLDLREVNRDASGDLDAVFAGATRLVSRFGARDQGFSGGTAGVDAGAADQFSLDQRDFHAG